jgi:hypothetical protein
MSTITERRRKPRSKPIPTHDSISITIEKPVGVVRQVTGKLIDRTESGLGIELGESLDTADVVKISGNLAGGLKSGGKVRVLHCVKHLNGTYRIGLELDASQEQAPAKGEALGADYYEILQLSPNADPDTVHRVYRLLAQRVHPDNPETGNQEQFRLILEAYRTLSDPELRAAYDVTLHTNRQLRWKIFDQREAMTGRAAERRKRVALLELLYTTRLSQPNQPSLNLHEIEDLLGCPREHLEFTLWYLKESGFVGRGDNGRYTITLKGIDHAELEDSPAAVDRRLLPAAQ